MKNYTLLVRKYANALFKYFELHEIRYEIQVNDGSSIIVHMQLDDEQYDSIKRLFRTAITDITTPPYREWREVWVGSEMGEALKHCQRNGITLKGERDCFAQKYVLATEDERRKLQDVIVALYDNVHGW